MKTQQQSIGKQKAIELAESNWWELCTDHEIAEFQLFTVELCMPFSRFHEAMEKALGRPVWTHEFGMNYDGLVAEFLGDRTPPTMQEIIELIPADKRIVIVNDKE